MRKLHHSMLALALSGIGLGAFVTAANAASIQRVTDRPEATSRSLAEFLAAQGSTSGFIPPLPDFIGWTNNNPQTMFASVDYAGVVAGYLLAHGGPDLGTQVDGTVMERPLADGRAEVTVNLHVTNALTWVIALPPFDIATDPLLFGCRGTDLLADPSIVPTVSNCQMKAVFTNTAPGAPLPDLIPVLFGFGMPGQEAVAILVNASGAGTLHAASGFGEGTPGRFNLINTGVFHASGKGGTADGFPAEVISLRPAGHAIVTGGGELSGLGSTAPGTAAATHRTSWSRIKSLYR